MRQQMITNTTHKRNNITLLLLVSLTVVFAMGVGDVAAADDFDNLTVNDSTSDLELSDSNTSENQTTPDPQIYRDGVPVGRGGHEPGYVYPNITAAIADALAGDTIMLEDGAIFNEQINVDKDLDFNVFNNGQATIDGSTFMGSIMTINSGLTVNLYNLIFQNGGYTHYGGAIYNQGTLTCTKCDFINNSVEDGDGGAIYSLISVVCTDCTFTGNEATIGNGGAISNNKGVVSFTCCAFTDNSADDNGGAIYTYDGELTCTNCDFTDNSADFGGAIYQYLYKGTCADCAFTDNSADYNGGAVYNRDGIMTFTGCDFIDNAADEGGAISNILQSELTCTNCDFTDNSADYGGAIYNEFGVLDCNSCDFTDNFAVQNGGAIYSGYGHVTVIGSNFESNIACRDGGAFKNYYGDFTLNFNRIVSNTATRYGQDIYDENNDPTDDHNALYNWWGSNDGPAAGSIEFDQVDLVKYDPWLVMTYSADPTTIQQGSTSTLTADFRYDSDSSLHDPALGHLPDGLPVTFFTDLGNVGSKSVVTYTLNGVATATLRGDEAAGVASTMANMDDETLTTPVIIRAAGGDDSDNSTNTISMQETGAPLTGMVLAILMVLGGFISTNKKQ